MSEVTYDELADRVAALADEWDSVTIVDEWDAADRWSEAPAALRALLEAEGGR